MGKRPQSARDAEVHAAAQQWGVDPARLKALSGRFSAPVFPGETIRTEIWCDGNIASFRARAVERDVIAINNGRAEVA